MNWRFILAGLFLLACGSFIDNSRGVLLPILTQQFDLSYTQSSGFFISGNFGSVIATFLLLPLTQHFSEKKLVIVTGVFGVIVLSLGGLVNQFWELMGFGAFLGFVLSSYGALSNLLIIHGTDLNSRSKMMCGLHMIYGLTSIISPLICDTFLSHGMTWWGCLASVILLLLGLLFFVTKKIPDEPPQAEKSKPSLRLNGLQRWVVFIFCLYITGEVLNSMWLVTYLVKTQGMSIGLSSRYLSAFFVVMTLTRALCFVSLEEKHEKFLLFGCLILSLVFMGLGHSGLGWAFSLSGVLGPFFPLFLGRVTRVFHLQSKTLTLWILAMGYVTLGLFHLGVGKIATALGMERAFWLPAVFIFLSILAYGVYLRWERSYLRGLH